MDSTQVYNGLNCIAPAESFFSTSVRDCVKLRIPEVGNTTEMMPPMTIPQVLAATVSNYPDLPALRKKGPDGTWSLITYRSVVLCTFEKQKEEVLPFQIANRLLYNTGEYAEQVRICAKAFVHLGLERHNSVCIIGFNSPEWFVSSLAAVHAGGVSVGVYTTNSSSACLHCASMNATNIFVVQDEKQLKKILEIKDQLPYLKAIVQYEGAPETSDALSWEKLMEIGRQQDDELLEARLKQIVVNECCHLVFTSGTVGQPKAAMLSHDSLIFNSTTMSETIEATKGNRFISYLPLSHVAALIADIYVPIKSAGITYFADKDALKGSLINTLKEVRPTYFLGVPRVWEKIQESLTNIAARNGVIKRYLGNWAKHQGYQYNMQKLKGESAISWGYTLANWLVFKKVKQALGLDAVKIVVSAAAPISAETKKYFLSLDIRITEIFGLTESSGPHTFTSANKFSLKGVGVSLPGMKTKIAEDTGEICLNGRHIFMGYLGDLEQTTEAFDGDGWLRSGDAGYIDRDGVLHVTGRLKELLITAGGENVAPVPIEQNVIQELPQLSNVMLIGDGRKYLSLIVTLKSEVDRDSVPQDALTVETKQWLDSLNCTAKTITEVLEAGPDSKLLQAINEGIERANKKAISNAQNIKKFAILPKDFSIPGGELGPTLKLKRNVVLAKYSDIIENLYRET